MVVVAVAHIPPHENISHIRPGYRVPANAVRACHEASRWTQADLQYKSWPCHGKFGWHIASARRRRGVRIDSESKAQNKFSAERRTLLRRGKRSWTKCTLHLYFMMCQYLANILDYCTVSFRGHFGVGGGDFPSNATAQPARLGVYATTDPTIDVLKGGMQPTCSRADCEKAGESAHTGFADGRTSTLGVCTNVRELSGSLVHVSAVCSIRRDAGPHYNASRRGAESSSS